MAFITNTLGQIPEVKQIITVNGQVDTTIWCNTVSIPTGLSPATASFYTPAQRWQSNLSCYRDSYIVVTVVVGAWSGVVFCGYVMSDSKDLSPDGNNATFTAQSVVGFLPKQFVGDSQHKPTVTYNLIDPTTGQTTHTTTKSIIESIISGLPSRYSARVRPGNMSVLSGPVDVPDPEITLRNTTVQAGIEQLTGYYGNVIICQRMTGNITYLDFVRMGAPSNPLNTVRVGFQGEAVYAGANVAKITHSAQSSDVTTKITVFGDPRRFGITLNNFAETPAAAKLLEDWDQSLEAAVLLDPKLASGKTIGSRAGMDKVLKQFRLPVCLYGYKKLKDLPISIIQQDGTAKPVQAQAFVWQKVLIDDEENPNKKIGVQVSEPVLETGVKWELDKNLVIFNEPVVRPVSMELINGVPVVTWEPAPFEISICVEDQVYSYATADGHAAAGINFDLAEDGLCENIPLDGIGERYLTNHGFAINNQTWNFRFYNDITKTQTYYSSSVNLIPNVKGTFQRIANEQLASGCCRAVTVNVEIPWYAPAYQIGNRLLITGDAQFESEVFTITGVSYDFTNRGQHTTLTADNSKPKHRVSLKSTKTLPAQPAETSDYGDQSNPTSNDYGQADSSTDQADDQPDDEFDPETAAPEDFE